MTRRLPRPPFVAAFLFIALAAATAHPPNARAQELPAARCASATDAAVLVLSPDQVGAGFRAELIPSPGRVDPPAPGWTRLDVLQGFRNGLVRVSQTVSSFEDAESAARYAADQATAGNAAVRCGVFVVGIGATIERQIAGQRSQIVAAPALAWAIVGNVIDAPAGCVTTHGLIGVPVAACGDDGSVVYDPETGRWLDLPPP